MGWLEDVIMRTSLIQWLIMKWNVVASDKKKKIKPCSSGELPSQSSCWLHTFYKLWLPSLLFHLGLVCCKIQNKEGMHLQQCSVITTQSTSIFFYFFFFTVKDNLHQTREDYRFQILVRKCHKNDTYSDTNMKKKNAARRAHARCANWHPKKWRIVCSTLLSVSVCGVVR